MVINESLTFDDVILKPCYSEILPSEVDVPTRLTREIMLTIPLVSAAMDTVTESEMAISLARQGGIGIIHRNLSIKDQAREVDRVKRSESGMIVDPITINPDQRISDALKIMKKYHISGVPVTVNGYLSGILTNRDLRFVENLDLRVEEVMTRDNLVTVDEKIGIEESKALLAQAPYRKTSRCRQRQPSQRSYHHQGHTEGYNLSRFGKGPARPPTCGRCGGSRP